MRRHSVSTQIDIAPDADEAELTAAGERVSTVWADLTRAAVDGMVEDGHGPEKIRTTPFLMMRYTGQLEDVEVVAPLPEARTPEQMRRVIEQFETVYAQINHRVSRYGEAGFTVAELGVIATAEKVKPMLVK